MSDVTGVFDNATTFRLTDMAVAIEHDLDSRLKAVASRLEIDPTHAARPELLIVVVDTVGEPRGDWAPGMLPDTQTLFAQMLYRDLWQCSSCDNVYGILIVLFKGMNRIEITVGPALTPGLCGDWVTPMRATPSGARGDLTGADEGAIRWNARRRSGWRPAWRWTAEGRRLPTRGLSGACLAVLALTDTTETP